MHYWLCKCAYTNTGTREKKQTTKTKKQEYLISVFLFLLSHLILLLFIHFSVFHPPLALQMQMEWNEVCSHGNINIIINGRCGDARAVMANSALSPWVTSWVLQMRVHTHAHTHTRIQWIKAVCTSFIQIHFALILQYGKKCNNPLTSMAPPKSIIHTQTHIHTHTHTHTHTRCVLEKWFV